MVFSLSLFVASDQGDDIERLVSMAPTVIRTDIPYRKVVDFKSSTPTERGLYTSFVCFSI